MPLVFAQLDIPYVIKRLWGKDAVRTHLRNLGLVESETVIVRQSIAGNLIVEIKGVRLALDEGLGRRIMV